LGLGGNPEGGAKKKVERGKTETTGEKPGRQNTGSIGGGT